MDFRSFSEINWQLYFIRAYTWLSFVVQVVKAQTVKSTKYLVNSFQPETYVFYKGSSTPVRLNDYAKDVAGCGTVDYYYIRDTHTLSKNLTAVHLPRTLNIELASIYHGDICLYDLTDFFDSTFYSGGQDIPSLYQWVGVWQLENGIYLDRSKEFQIEITLLGGSKQTFGLWDTDQSRWNALTSSAPRLHRQVFRALNTDCSCSSNAVCTPARCEEAKCEAKCEEECNPVMDLSGSVVDLSGNTAPVVEEESTPEN